MKQLYQKFTKKKTTESTEKHVNLLWSLIYFGGMQKETTIKLCKMVEFFVLKKYDFRNWRLNSEISELYALSNSNKNKKNGLRFIFLNNI